MFKFFTWFQKKDEADLRSMGRYAGPHSGKRIGNEIFRYEWDYDNIPVDRRYDPQWATMLKIGEVAPAPMAEGGYLALIKTCITDRGVIGWYMDRDTAVETVFSTFDSQFAHKGAKVWCDCEERAGRAVKQPGEYKGPKYLPVDEWLARRQGKK
jgi:hypothetical protein